MGDNPPNISYERSIIKQGADFNIKVKRNVLAKNATMDAILSVIDRANRDDKIDGIMMFRPLLSPHLDQKLAENFIIAEKDVDGITRASNADQSGRHTRSGNQRGDIPGAPQGPRSDPG